MWISQLNVASSALEKGDHDNSSTGQGNKRNAFPAKFPLSTKWTAPRCASPLRGGIKPPAPKVRNWKSPAILGIIIWLVKCKRPNVGHTLNGNSPRTMAIIAPKSSTVMATE